MGKSRLWASGIASTYSSVRLGFSKIFLSLFLVLSSSASAQLVDVSASLNGGSVKTYSYVHFPKPAGGAGSVVNLIDTAERAVSPGYDNTFVGTDSGIFSKFIFKFAVPSPIQKIQLVVPGTCAQWKVGDGLPQKFVVHFSSGDRREFQIDPSEYAFNANGSAIRIAKNVVPPVLADGAELEVTDLMSSGDAPSPNCFSNSQLLALYGVEFLGSVEPRLTKPFNIFNVAFDRSTRSFSWQTSVPSYPRLTYYGDVGGGKYDLKTVGFDVPGGTSFRVPLGPDFVSGYAILSNVDPNGNTTQLIPDAVLHEAGLVGVPYQSTGEGVLIDSQPNVPLFQRRDGLGAAAQFAYIFISENIVTDLNAQSDYRARVLKALEEGLSPIILFNWFGFTSFCSFNPSKAPHHPFNPAQSCDQSPSATIQQNYYDACRILAGLVGGLPNNHRVLIALEPEWNTMDSMAFEPRWDDIMLNAIAIFKDGKMPNGTIVPSAGAAKIGTNIYAMATRTLTMKVSMPRAAARLDFIGLHKYSADTGGLDAFHETLTLSAEQAFRSFLKPILFYAPCNLAPGYTQQTQAEAIAYHFQPRGLVANSFNLVNHYYPAGANYRDAWNQSRLFGIIGPTFLNSGAFDFGLNDSLATPRLAYYAWKKLIEDSFAQETFSPELDMVPVISIPTSTQAQVAAHYDSPCQLQVYYGPEAALGPAPWTSFKYTQTTAWTGVTNAPSILISGLLPNTRYHCRLRALSPDGVIDCSPDFVFTTTPTGPLPAPVPLASKQVNGLLGIMTSQVGQVTDIQNYRYDHVSNGWVFVDECGWSANGGTRWWGVTSVGGDYRAASTWTYDPATNRVTMTGYAYTNSIASENDLAPPATTGLASETGAQTQVNSALQISPAALTGPPATVFANGLFGAIRSRPGEYSNLQNYAYNSGWGFVDQAGWSSKGGVRWWGWPEISDGTLRACSTWTYNISTDTMIMTGYAYSNFIAEIRF